MAVWVICTEPPVPAVLEETTNKTMILTDKNTITLITRGLNMH